MRDALFIWIVFFGMMPDWVIAQVGGPNAGATSGPSVGQGYDQGRAAYEAGRWADALTIFRELELQESSADAPVRFAIGTCLVRLAIEETSTSERNQLLREAISKFRAAKRASDHDGLTWEMIETNLLVAKSLYQIEPVDESSAGEKRLAPDEAEADEARTPNDEEGGLPMPATDDPDGEEGDVDRSAIDQGEVTRPAPGRVTTDPGPIDPAAARARLRVLRENSGPRSLSALPGGWGPARSPRDY